MDKLAAIRTGEADFGGGRRGGTRPDGADGSRGANRLSDWMTTKRHCWHGTDRSGRLMMSVVRRRPGSGVSGPSGRRFTLGVDARIRRFAHVVLQEIGINPH